MANPEYLSIAIKALTRFYEVVGDKAKFSFDQFWDQLTPEESIVPSKSRPSLAKPLVALGYIKPTGRMRNSATQARAGSRGTEYTFGQYFLGTEVASGFAAGMESAKPFLILAGPSGTGKSRWVRQQAYLTWFPSSDERQKNSTPPNYALIPIKPNWHDSSELLGYVTRLGLGGGEKARYVATDFVRFVARAWMNPQSPHWLCLDEMNLAPVEQYFAEFLSVIETRRVEDDAVVTDPILPATVFNELNDDDWARFCADIGVPAGDPLREKFRVEGISLPQNLIVVGTVNMDETTHSFSRKVLDRAFVWEMPIGDLSSGWEPLGYPEEPTPWSPLLATSGADVHRELEDVAIGQANAKNYLVDWLVLVNKALANTPFQVSYRIRDELLLLAAARGVSNSDEMKRLLDDGLYSKILPRIEGDEARTRKPLERLYRFLLEAAFEGNESTPWKDAVDGGEDREIDLGRLASLDAGPSFLFGSESWPSDPFAPALPWRRSLNKIRSMLLKLEGQFTSYWD